MKKKPFSLFLLFLLAIPTVVQAQYLRSSYFMESTSARLRLNPALCPSRGYVDLPAIGSLAVEVSSNSLSSLDVIDVIDSDGNFYNNSQFYNKLKGTNSLNVNVNTDIISFGFHTDKGFWSFNAGARVDLDASIPKSMFDYLRAVDAEDFSWANNQTFTIRDEKLRLNAYTELGAGYSRIINSRLTLGAKAKILLGAGNIALKINELHLSSKAAGMDSEFQLRSNAQLEASAKGLELEEDENGYISDLDYSSFGIGGYGVGLDLGASYAVTENLVVSASVIDLGFISWSKASTTVASSNQNMVVDKTNYGDTPDFLDFDLYGLKQEKSKARTTSLTPTMVLGGEYSVFNSKLGLGLLSTTHFGQLKTYSELMLAATYRPNTLINATLSYSMLQGGETFGVAFKVGPLMLGSDYLFLGNNAKHLNAYIGMSIPLGKKKKS